MTLGLLSIKLSTAPSCNVCSTKKHSGALSFALIKHKISQHDIVSGDLVNTDKSVTRHKLAAYHKPIDLKNK